MHKRVIGLWIGLVLVAASASQGTTLVRQDLASLVDQAELIFVGTVVHTQAVETKDEAFAFTYVTFEVEDALKGSAADSQLTLRFAGAELGGQVFEVRGMPTFELGGRHLLFVEGNGRAGCPLVGWWQGKLDFAAHPFSGETVLLDANRQVVNGIERQGWRTSPMQLSGEGLLKSPAPAGVEVVEQDGVTIDLPVVVDPAEEAVAVSEASSVLGELRAMVARRAGKSTFRQAPPVVSASPADVPASFVFSAYRIPQQ